MIIVAGTVRIPEDKVHDLRPIALKTMEASRAEVGCITYSYAFDVEEPGLMRVFEEWESRADLDAHQRQPHLKPWRAKLDEVGASGRQLRVYKADSGEAL
ncbi:MAG: putative quinol monooxygenase [Acidimicrobiia bacterium]|jgi:quinol monooxygenase YgiN